MKSLMSLLQHMLADASIWCCTSTTQDWKTILSRSEHEGLSFLTITLPSFCKDFESCLAAGKVVPGTFLSFKKRGHLPLFMGGFAEQVFDRSSGVLLDEPSKEAIFFVRQITLTFKKILLPSTKKREMEAFNGYIKCEKEVRAWTECVSDDCLERFSNLSDLVLVPVLCDLDRKVYERKLSPKHGPGSTADRILGNRKYEIDKWPTRYEEFFPVADYVIPNYGWHSELNRVNFLEPGDEIPVKVISVPKTLKTPRIIAMEPTYAQYAQQALMQGFVESLEGADSLSGAIAFTDQLPNRRFACEGSCKGNLATIDLSEASDRVSNLLVRRMLQRLPHLAGAVAACRTTRAAVPDHYATKRLDGNIREITVDLAKFASMGSALCFPVEAMVFTIIVLLGIQRELSIPLTRKSVKTLLKTVRVYGDDIIVPTRFVRSVMRELEAFGLRVNTAKSFWTGKFRESCGGDYYDGTDVTVTYVRRVLPSSRKDVEELISTISLRNQLYKAGMWKTVGYLDNLVERFAPFPNVLESSPVLGRNSFLGYNTERECPNLHVPLVKGLVVSSRAPPSPLEGYGALMKFFLKQGSEPFQDKRHLERSGRPDSVNIKVRWSKPY